MPQRYQKPPVSGLSLDEVFPNSMSLKARDERPIDVALVPNASIPVSFWRIGWFLTGIDDNSWRCVTSESETETFPKTLRKRHRTHPGYVFEEIGNYAIKLCPCTTKGRWDPCIPRGCKLQVTDVEMTVTSYVLLRCACNIPRNSYLFGKKPRFRGVFPPEQLHFPE